MQLTTHKSDPHPPSRREELLSRGESWLLSSALLTLAGVILGIIL